MLTFKITDYVKNINEIIYLYIILNWKAWLLTVWQKFYPDLLMRRVGSGGEVNPTQPGSKLGWILATHPTPTTQRVTRLDTQKLGSWQHMSPLILIVLERVRVTQINPTLGNPNNPNGKPDSIDPKTRVYLHDLHALIDILYALSPWILGIK
jgi:hypothetical protein